MKFKRDENIGLRRLRILTDAGHDLATAGYGWVSADQGPFSTPLVRRNFITVSLHEATPERLRIHTQDEVERIISPVLGQIQLLDNGGIRREP